MVQVAQPQAAAFCRHRHAVQAPLPRPPPKLKARGVGVEAVDLRCVRRHKVLLDRRGEARRVGGRGGGGGAKRDVRAGGSDGGTQVADVHTCAQLRLSSPAYGSSHKSQTPRSTAFTCAKVRTLSRNSASSSSPPGASASADAARAPSGVAQTGSALRGCDPNVAPKQAAARRRLPAIARVVGAPAAAQVPRVSVSRLTSCGRCSEGEQSRGAYSNKRCREFLRLKVGSDEDSWGFGSQAVWRT